MSGAILVEVIFAYPGVGYRLYQAIQAKDYSSFRASSCCCPSPSRSTMLIMDLLYPLIDPRITARRS